MSDFEQKLLQGFVDRPPITPEEAAELVRIAEAVANWHQVSKALCDKENATLDEILQVIDQVKVELAFVTLERDALFSEIKQCNDCYFCKHYGTRIDVEPCQTCILDFQQQDFKPGFEWRGVCPENTEVQEDD